MYFGGGEFSAELGSVSEPLECELETLFPNGQTFGLHPSPEDLRCISCQASSRRSRIAKVGTILFRVRRSIQVAPNPYLCCGHIGRGLIPC